MASCVPEALRRLAAALALALAAGPAGAQEPPRLVPGGPPVTVFRHATDACAEDDIPDTAARALRRADGTVVLFASHYRNRAMSGPGLLALARDCRVSYQGAESPDPARFDDRAWIAATWTPDGVRVSALLHTEYQGVRFPGQCPSAQYVACWYNAIALAGSTDGGRSFRRAGLVAAPPYRYDPGAGQNVGYFNPSGMVARDGYVYAFVFAQRYRAQEWGNCLLRSATPEDPASWRAWDGEGFGVRLADPYRRADGPAPRTCRPVGLGRLRGGVTALVRHVPSGLYLALFPSRRTDALAGPDLWAWASASRDLLHWSEPTPVMALGSAADERCDGPASYGYVSLLDPDSPSRNFDTVGARAFLFLTRWNRPDCGHPLDRDLVRVPVTIVP